MIASQGPLPVFALAPVASWDIGDWLIAILIIGGACAVFYVIWTQALGWTVPPWLLKVFGIMVAIVVGVAAIRFILAQ